MPNGSQSANVVELYSVATHDYAGLSGAVAANDHVPGSVNVDVSIANKWCSLVLARSAGQRVVVFPKDCSRRRVVRQVLGGITIAV